MGIFSAGSLGSHAQHIVAVPYREFIQQRTRRRAAGLRGSLRRATSEDEKVVAGKGLMNSSGGTPPEMPLARQGEEDACDWVLE